KPEVRQKTVERLVAALKLADESPIAEDALAPYREKVAEKYGMLDFRGLALPRADPLLLDAVFVPIRMRISPFRAEENCKGNGDRLASDVLASRFLPHLEGSDLTTDDCLQR